MEDVTNVALFGDLERYFRRMLGFKPGWKCLLVLRFEGRKSEIIHLYDAPEGDLNAQELD